jgi:hypothetical protein
MEVPPEMNFYGLLTGEPVLVNTEAACFVFIIAANVVSE